MKHTWIIASSITLLMASLPAAENWPQFRGPEFNGSSPEANLPTKFSKEENVKWSVDMPGTGSSTPAIWGDHVFITSTDPTDKALEAFCLDRKTGKVLWKNTLKSEIQQDDRSNYAAPSPSTDGTRVIFFYGTGDLLAFDMDGKEIWKRNIQKDYGTFAFQWTFSTSPVLFDGHVYMQVLQRDVQARGRGFEDKPNESYVLSLDAATGKEVWRHIRPCEAVAESREAFTTPMIFNHDGKTQLVICGGDCISGHDIDAKGEELWRWGTWNPKKIGHWRLVASPVAGEGIALACAPKKEPIYAVKLGGKGMLDDSALAWVSEEKAITSDVPTPIYYGGRFYILNGNGPRPTLSCVKPATGEIVWSEVIGRTTFEASPTAADGKIYLMNHKGDVFVVKASDTYELLHETSMGEEDAQFTRSTIAIAQENLFIRTNEKLYCIGKG
ncbi:MAG: outer membrane protein assembly factor BamB [Verrucomicrobiales bacterium]|jgi:outer membrane protein assembly factor BamB